MGGFLDFFSKQKNGIIVLLLLGVISIFVSLLLLFLEVKIAGIVNMQLPQSAAGLAVGSLGVLVLFLALAASRQEISAATPTAVVPAPEKTEAVTATTGQPSPVAASVEAKPATQSPIDHTGALINAGAQDDVEVFDKAHKEFLLAVEDPSERDHWDAWALHQRFEKYGKLESFKKLREKVSDKNCSLFYVVWLASCYGFNSEPNEQKNLLKGFLERGVSENYAYLICEYADIVEQLDGPNAARDVYATCLPRMTKNTAKSRVLANFAELLRKLEEKTLSAAAYELVFALSDTPSITRFNAGYAQSSVGFDYLSFKNYEVHLRKEPDHDMALNNMGVHCDTFKMQGKSVEFYRRSVERGATLAMANLAYVYISKGLFTEAEEILGKAVSLRNPHSNVMAAFNHLKAKKEEEAKSWNGVLKRGIEEQEFMRGYGTAALLEPTTIVSMAGQWLLSEGKVITLTQEASKITGMPAIARKLGCRWAYSIQAQRSKRIPFRRKKGTQWRLLCWIYRVHVSKTGRRAVKSESVSLRRGKTAPF